MPATRQDSHSKNFTRLKSQLEDAKRAATLRTVILWGPEDLLGDAVEAVLTARSDWNVVRVLDDQRIEALTREVEQIKPELVIVNRDIVAGNFHALFHLVQICPTLKIITVNPDNNLIEVYDKRMIQIREIADLLSIIGDRYNLRQMGGDSKNIER